MKLHTEEWQELAYEASCEPSPQTTFNYVNSLFKPVRETIWPILATKFELDLPCSIHEIAQLAMTSMREYMEDINVHDSIAPITRKRQYMGNQDGIYKKRQYGNCPIHPKGRHAANDCLILGQLNRTQPNISQHAHANKDKGQRLCKYCKKVPYQPGHKCSEYYQQRKVIHNRSTNVNKTPSSRDQAILDHLLPVNLEKMDITGTGFPR